LLKNIQNKQNFLIKKAKKHHAYLKKNPKSSIRSIDYFCTFGETPGFALQNFWLNKFSGSYLLIKTILKDIYSIFNYLDYEILNHNDKKKTYNKVIITWATNKNFQKNFYKDNYFNVKSSQVKNSHWIVIFTGKKLPINVPSNVTILKCKKNKFNFLIFFKIIKKNLYISKFNFKIFLNLTSGYFKFSSIVNEIFLKKLNKNVRLVIMPYEAQPFQSAIIKSIKKFSKKIITKGYLHSYPALPSHLIKKDDSPNFLIVNSRDLRNSLIKKLNWRKNEIILKPSSRFQKKSIITIEPGKIYFPISIKSVEMTLKSLDKLFLVNNNVNFRDLKVMNHPHGTMFKKNILLEEKTNFLIIRNKNKNKKNFYTKKNTFSIFIEGTGAIIEALERNIDVYHITENPIFDCYTTNFWNNIECVKIDQNIFKYSLFKKNHTLLLGNTLKEKISYFSQN
jgi:hypothetical protein